MSYSIFDIQADFCRAIANGSRLHIVHILRDHPMQVTDIAHATELHSSLVSRHLGVLRGMGMVRSHRQGIEIIYQLTDENIPKLCDLVQKVVADNTQRHSKRIFPDCRMVA